MMTRDAGVRKRPMEREHGEEQGIYIISLYLPINYLLVTKKNIVTLPRDCKHSLTRLIKMNEYTDSRTQWHHVLLMWCNEKDIVSLKWYSCQKCVKETGQNGKSWWIWGKEYIRALSIYTLYLHQNIQFLKTYGSRSLPRLIQPDSLGDEPRHPCICFYFFKLVQWF